MLSNTICYQCEKLVTQINERSRCLKCETQRSNANEAENDKLRENYAAVDALHPSVLRMAFAMQSKLDKNKNKDCEGSTKADDGSRLRPNAPGDTWSKSYGFLLRKLGEEVGELIEAVYDKHGREDVANEAADVANVAMMIAEDYLEE